MSKQALNISVVTAFLQKKKLLVMNRQAQLFFSFCYCLTSTITVQYNFCPRNKYNIFLSKRSLRYLFRYFLESSTTCCFSAVLTMLLLTIVSVQPCLLQTNSSSPMLLSETQGMFNWNQICQDS